MPLQNRVNPFGDLFRTSARGTLMGNRGGVLHNGSREIVRSFKSSRWIACLLEFKRRHRIVMSERLYTELFFLDEAVAFAAGHRPCAECRRQHFNDFRNAWRRRSRPDALPMAGEMDSELHPARIDSRGAKVTYQAPGESLPDGCFVQLEEDAYLVWGTWLLLWTPEGYARRDDRPRNLIVTVLTPQPIVECFRQGYRPQLHSSGQVLLPPV
jgi:hypothetical protein